MKSENMRAFLEIPSKDEAAYKKAGTLEKDALIAFAKELGADLTERDFEAPEEALSADGLAAVTLEVTARDILLPPMLTH